MYYNDLLLRLQPAGSYFPLDDGLSPATSMTSLQTGHVLDPTYQADVAMHEIIDMASEIATDSIV